MDFLNVIVSQQGRPIPLNKSMPDLDEYEGIGDVAHYTVLYTLCSPLTAC